MSAHERDEPDGHHEADRHDGSRSSNEDGTSAVFVAEEFVEGLAHRGFIPSLAPGRRVSPKHSVQPRLINGGGCHHYSTDVQLGINLLGTIEAASTRVLIA